MSDNGGFVNAYKGEQVTDNWPLRSGKGSLYEGGIRVPMIVRWPGVTPAAGGTSDEPVMCTDWFKTLAEAAGVPAAGVGDSGCDGVSLARVLKDPAAKLGRDAVFFHYPHYYATTTPVGAIRQGDWKLLEYFEDGKLELYNLKEDLGEKNDLAGNMQEKAKELHAKLVEWRKTVGAQMPAPNKKRGAT
jgi:arylsulfatase A-like enzyme